MKKKLKFISFLEKKPEEKRPSFLLQQNKTTKKGFSLVEMLVSIFIFSILMALIGGTFAGFYKNYSRQKKTQKDIENAQYVLNSITKRLRTSAIISPSNKTNFSLSDSNFLDTYDYSLGQCIRYSLENNIMKYSISVAPDPASCNFDDNTYFLELSSNNINRVQVISKPTGGSNDKGWATIVFYVQQDTASPGLDTSEIPIQSSVSLRQ